MIRHDYHTGLKSREAAEDALEDAFATGEILMGERPEITSYTLPSKARRWKITVAG